MSLALGARLGVYEIVAAIGAGGMGEVYRAHDAKLERDVAIKILPEAVAADPERKARFEREAKTLAALNHPNIAHIYGLEKADGAIALVMELVDGPTLEERIAQGSIPVDEALPIAKQIAEALEAAHEQGIIHRDLKPANIKVRADGTVKVLDFGLAKAMDPAQGLSPSASMSPTITTPAMTQLGVILGTAAYMSPEQAKGKPSDRATDVWAFGCVVYEMLTGRPAFEGETVNEVLGAVFRAGPDWTRLPPATPESVRRLLRRCLQKDVRLRLHDMQSAWIELAESQSGTVSNALPQAKVSSRIAWSAAAVVALIAVVEGAWLWRSGISSTVPPEVRLEIATPPTTDPLSLALSPDGKKIVFIATSAGRPQLWLRRLDAVSARPLAGTEFASMPFWSPDNRSVGFFANSGLRAVDIEGGVVQKIADAVVPGGAAWNPDGVVLFPIVPDSPLFRVSVKAGSPVPVSNLEPRGVGQRDPQFLPDGHRFLYYVASSAPTRGIYLGDLKGGPSRWLLDADSGGVYAPSGHLLFVRQGTLFAQGFDAVRGVMLGNAHPMAEQIAFGGPANLAAVSTSSAGPIAYRTGSTGGKRQLIWVDRSGRQLATVTEPGSFGPAYVSMSPDHTRLAVQRSIDGNVDIWLIDLDRAGTVRFTTDPRPEIAPLWSPRGDRIVFSAITRGEAFDLYQKTVDGVGSDALLITEESKQATDWSRDGRYVLYRSRNPKTGWDIWALPLGPDKQPFPVVQTNFDERDAQFSPDGKWIAYQSNDSGRFEIYVQSFPRPGARIPVSTGGGAQAKWRSDGKELFYIASDGTLTAVAFHGDSSPGQSVRIGSPTPLFFANVGAFEDISLPHYVVSPDGQRFLMDTVVEENAAAITVILNWKPTE